MLLRVESLPSQAVNESLADRLAALMEQQAPGQSVSRVAREAGVTFHTLQRTLAGETQPNSYTVEKLAARFNVSVEYLLTGADVPPRPSGDLEEVIRELRARVDSLAADLRELQQRRD